MSKDADIYNCGKTTVIIRFSKRFAKDKVCSVDNEVVTVIDGITVNKSELTNARQSWEAWCRRKDGGYICKDMRGVFSGVKYDSCHDSFYAFGNQTGDEPIFYYKKNGSVIISSDFNVVWSIARENNWPISFDELSANMMLSHGYLYYDNTFVKEIKKVRPGCMIVKEEGTVDIDVKTYHRFKKNIVLGITEEQAIEMVEDSFAKAVKRLFDKDIEYGYSHLADISGGLDSRTTNQVALDLGYKNVTNISYAKSGSVEYDCAQAYSESVGNDFIFKALDDLNFFYDIDESIEHLYGLTYYFACTGGTRIMRSLNTQRFGLEHSGGLGDAVLGEFHQHDGHFSFEATSTTSNIIRPHKPDLNEDGEDEEIHWPYYTRMLSFTVISQLVKKYYDWIAVSPFADVDFIDTCLSIPLEMREGHKLYFDWLYAKHPTTTNERCTTVDSRIHKPPMNFRHFVGRIVGKRRNQVIALVKKLTGKDLELKPVNQMNPFDYWYETQPKLRNFMQQYYSEHLSLLDNYPNTKKDVETMFTQGLCLDKGCVLTVLAAYNRYIK